MNHLKTREQKHHVIKINGLFTFLLCVFSNIAWAQAPRTITETELESMRAAIDAEALVRQQVLEEAAEDQNSSRIAQVFAIDTFKIEELMARKVDIDYSTLGMVDAALDAESAYDLLLNKYYGWLLHNLSDADAEILKQSQRNWIQFRDSERKLNALLVGETYSGGGTMQQIIGAGGYLDITKQRVIELYQYLERLEQMEVPEKPGDR